MSAAETILADPGYMLHRVDVAGERLVFLPSRRDLLAEAIFLDGRTDIAAGAPVELGFADALRAHCAPAGACRFVFHVSFCGSTLMSRLVGEAGSALVLREPQCLVDLADWKAALLRQGRQDERFAPLLRLACALLFRRWSEGEPVVVKPSNWVNNLLPDLCADPAFVHPLFMTMERRRFLHAVLRGDRERIGFTAHVAAHLATTVPDGDTLLASAIASSPLPLGKALALAVLAYDLQRILFARAMSEGEWKEGHHIDLEAILADPRAAVVKADAALALTRPGADIRSAVERVLERDAKRPGSPFSSAMRAETDRDIESYHGAIIDAALAWSDRAFAERPAHEPRRAEPRRPGRGRGKAAA